ncbi:MAG: delta-aminolevulinic acid dehydratase [Pelagibacteraceae bacterium TMED216]|nr:MAG: delta-aminolevulinic acid dehydratase [Pelagibacteraceae bacterium TMED216]|tara:strand:+ start:3459 stop:4457 length:999 start_codon:yes stop_codon:yes gene_type:complete
MKILGNYPTTRLRRVRNTNWIRRLVSENDLSVNDLILPIFLTEGKNKIENINNMPGIKRYSVDKLNIVLKKCNKYKIPMVALFPYTQKQKRDPMGKEALNENNLVCKAIRFIKNNFPNTGIMCDVALDPYTSHGHDGVLKNNDIDNDETLKILSKQALVQAKAGCDVIAPSDMMDGRIGLIRKKLDKFNYKDTKILSYAVKYASNFYGPFRDAVGSRKILKGDKKTYQMDFRNSDEALREVGLDIKEGADFIMVKPGLPYLDIIRIIKDKFKIPVFSYQVSGEYSLLKNGIKKKIISDDAVKESLISLKRAGSSAIVTYFALEIAEKLKKFK